MNDRDTLDEAARTERIRRRAYQIWEQEGRPPGRDAAHWDMAAEQIAIEDNQQLATKPVTPPGGRAPSGEPVEPLEAVENQGEFPTLTDQGEEQTSPRRGPTTKRRKS